MFIYFYFFDKEQSACIPVSPSFIFKYTIVCVSDSSMDSDAFIYGFASELRKVSARLLWMVCKPGKGALDLAEAWTCAPPCDFGLTILNCNDGQPDYIFTENITVAVKDLVQKSRDCCATESLFFVNHPDFFSSSTT